MGLSISPQVWITYIENLLEGIPNRQAYIAIMDDLMLHGLKADHTQLFKQLLVSLILHGLKLSPRKCQLIMKHLVYLGNVFHIEDGVITITPMKSMIEAIQKLLPPTTVKECKSFYGAVNYLSLFCKDLQKILKPICELTRKERPFLWTEFHQKILSKSKNCSSNLQYYIYADLEVDSYYIVIPLRPMQVAPYGKCKMANPDS